MLSTIEHVVNDFTEEEKKPKGSMINHFVQVSYFRQITHCFFLL